MKKNIPLFLLIALITPSLQSTESEEPKEKIVEFTGYVNYKTFYDTRQVVGVTEDQTVFFPKPIDCSPTGDINAHGHLQMLPFETRMRITLREPHKKYNFSCKGIIEVEFRGVQTLVNIVNMRHAFAQLDIRKTTLIFGQTWHTLNVEDLIPNTVSFNSGRPFAVYNRSPQIRYTQHLSNIDIILSAASQVDFQSDGPVGLSTTYIRNAIIPNFDFQVKGFFGQHVVGTGIDYQRISPRQVSPQGYKVHEDLSSVTGIWFLGLNWPKLTVKNTMMFGGNLSNYGVTGGYAVKKGSTDPITGQQKYTNIRTFTAWSDITVLPAQHIEPGVFLGISKNFGSAHEIEPTSVDPDSNPVLPTVYGLGTDINIMFRVSPRIRVKIGQVTFAGEIEYTRAAYGHLTNHGHVIHTAPVANTQFLFSTFLFF
jgi:hypothetical protein